MQQFIEAVNKRIDELIQRTYYDVEILSKSIDVLNNKLNNIQLQYKDLMDRISKHEQNFNAHKV